jgi:hypothetical protein
VVGAVEVGRAVDEEEGGHRSIIRGPQDSTWGA